MLAYLKMCCRHYAAEYEFVTTLFGGGISGSFALLSVFYYNKRKRKYDTKVRVG